MTYNSLWKTFTIIVIIIITINFIAFSQSLVWATHTRHLHFLHCFDLWSSSLSSSGCSFVLNRFRSFRLSASFFFFFFICLRSFPLLFFAAFTRCSLSRSHVRQWFRVFRFTCLSSLCLFHHCHYPARHFTRNTVVRRLLVTHRISLGCLARPLLKSHSLLCFSIVHLSSSLTATTTTKERKRTLIQRNPSSRSFNSFCRPVSWSTELG